MNYFYGKPGGTVYWTLVQYGQRYRSLRKIRNPKLEIRIRHKASDGSVSRLSRKESLTPQTAPLEKLAMMRLSAVSWYDLGTPERVVKTINELGIRPEWLAALQGVGNHRGAARTNARTRMAANSLFMPALFLN